jgi:transglutaminase-like putative cysteine protease
LSGLTAAAPRVAARAPAAPRAEASAGATLALQLAAFAGLAAFAALHWAQLIAPAPAWRAIAVAAIGTAGAAALGITGLRASRLSRRAATALRIAIALLMLTALLAATGLPFRYIVPSGWGSLRDGLDRGLVGTSTISWPYAAGDPWIRMSILLGMPAAIAFAAVAAFAPTAARARAAGRTVALIALVGMYSFAVTELGLGSHALRGAALLLLIAAWLWLPRVRRRDAVAAAAVVVSAGLLAIPLSHSLNVADPWIDWKNWNWFSSAAGEGFQWDHQYGPIGWPRTGRTVLDVKAARAHYWKAETLDRFDGLRWIHSNTFLGSDISGALPDRINPRWVETIRVADRGVHSDVLIGAGTIFDYSGEHAVMTTGDGTTRIVDGSLGKGESYSVRAYVPDPTAAQMRATPLDTSSMTLPFIQFALPARSLREVGQLVQLAPWNAPGAATSVDSELVQRSPYRRMYELAQSLAIGAPTAYDVVKRTQAYLESHYQYSEQPPARTYPLEAFLFKDEIGYCQQFSGAMALMLRMDGIPARVAGGFAPGLYDAAAREYRVRDLDAHSWVEVWFRGIGWVPFDPTPTIAPASLQATGFAAASAANGDAKDRGATPSPEQRLRGARAATAPSPGPGANRLWIALGAVTALVLGGIAAIWALVTLRNRHLRRHHDEPAIAELSAALAMLGYRIAPGTTLVQLERRLRTVADERAAGYVKLLRIQRFGARPGAGPTSADRRALRSSLTTGRGPLGRLRGFVALPPRRAQPTAF